LSPNAAPCAGLNDDHDALAAFDCTIIFREPFSPFRHAFRRHVLFLERTQPFLGERSVLFLMLCLVRTIGAVAILILKVGTDPFSVAVILFFWGIPLLFVIFSLGFVEQFSSRCGTYVTSLASFAPFLSDLLSGRSHSFFEIGIAWCILWIVTGLLAKTLMPPRPLPKRA
jgi:hypothetical protein